jgi:hypothetical protein
MEIRASKKKQHPALPTQSTGYREQQPVANYTKSFLAVKIKDSLTGAFGL